jgi:adenosylhomocysteine nucleosidase
LTVGFVVALKAEARSLTKRAVFPYKSVRLPGSALLRLAGMGPDRARRAADALVVEGATALISWGCAGGLQESILSGTLILPDRILASDQTTLPVDKSWRERLLHRLQEHLDIMTGPLIESPSVLRSPPEKTALFERSGALAVDMESAAIAQVAAAAQLPFLAVRAVSDSATLAIPPPVLNATDAFGRVRLLHLFTSLARRPHLLPNLIRVGLSFHAAQNTLTKVARLTGPQLLAP